MMNYIFRKTLRKGVLVYFDDILIYSKSWSEHLENLREVLEILREHLFFAKKSKGSFLWIGLSSLDSSYPSKGCL